MDEVKINGKNEELEGIEYTPVELNLIWSSSYICLPSLARRMQNSS